MRWRWIVLLVLLAAITVDLLHTLDMVPRTLDLLLVVLALLIALPEAIDITRKYVAERRAHRLLSVPYDEWEIAEAQRFYIRPNCTDIDISGSADRLDDSGRTASQRDLFQTLNQLLLQPGPRRHVLVLAESGVGKTAFIINYLYAALKEKTLPCAIAAASLSTANSLERLGAIPHPRNTVLLLDAFDEDTEAERQPAQRLETVMRACEQFKAVVLTCRTQFFPAASEIPSSTGIRRIGTRAAGERHAFEFTTLYILPFDSEQADRYVRKRFPLWRLATLASLGRNLVLRRSLREVCKKMPEVSRRPMLLAALPDYVADRGDLAVEFELYDIYEFVVDRWIARESWLAPETLRTISEKLAVDLYTHRETRGGERISEGDFSIFLSNSRHHIDLWKLRRKSLLHRDVEGNIKFVHRPIMEFLWVSAFVKGERQCLDRPWTDTMKILFLSWVRLQRKEDRTKLRSFLEDRDFDATGLFPQYTLVLAITGVADELRAMIGRPPREVGVSLLPVVADTPVAWESAFLEQYVLGDCTVFVEPGCMMIFAVPCDARRHSPEEARGKLVRFADAIHTGPAFVGQLGEHARNYEFERNLVINVTYVFKDLLHTSQASSGPWNPPDVMLFGFITMFDRELGFLHRDVPYWLVTASEKELLVYVDRPKTAGVEYRECTTARMGVEVPWIRPDEILYWSKSKSQQFASDAEESALPIWIAFGELKERVELQRRIRSHAARLRSNHDS